MAKYLYPPGSKLGDMPTAQTHMALPRDAAERDAWSQAAGFPVAGRTPCQDGSPFYVSRELMDAWVKRDVADWEGEAGL